MPDPEMIQLAWMTLHTVLDRRMQAIRETHQTDSLALAELELRFAQATDEMRTVIEFMEDCLP